MKKYHKLLTLVLPMLAGGVEAVAQTTGYTNDIVNYTSNQSPYKCVAVKDKVPALWSKVGWKDVITMYFGGWKYQSGSSIAGVYPEGATSATYQNNNDGSSVTDSWVKAVQHKDYIEDYKQPYFDNYMYNSFGSPDNSRSEFVENAAANGYKNAGKFEPARGGFPKGNPFTVPCFGCFLKFEPEQNGTVVLYLVQNGIVDLSTSSTVSDGAVGLDSKASWRPTYIVDELGVQLTDKDGVTADTYQTIYIGMTPELHKNATNTGQITFHEPDGKVGDDGVSSATKFWDAAEALYNGRTEKQKDALDKYWGTNAGEFDNNGPKYDDNGKLIQRKMQMIPPSETDDGWIAINKAYVKYTFKVQAGKSYYVINNDSKVGFCGYEFTSDTQQPTGTLEISETGYTPQKGYYSSVTLNRTFKQGWNAICLPFSVTESKMRDWFGTNGQETYELVTYNGAKKVEDEDDFSTTKDGKLIAYFFRHAYQDILAGYPYMLYIPEKAKALDPQTNGLVSFKNITIEDNVEMATFCSSEDYTTTGTSKYQIATEKDYIFEGTFGQKEIPAGSYVVYGIGSNSEAPDETGIRLLSSASTINGLRSYLRPNTEGTSDVQGVKRIVGTNFSNVIDDSKWNDANVINDLMAEMGFFNQKENVYSITGQLVRQNSTSLVGLPKGIYIVNGKKYFVK